MEARQAPPARLAGATLSRALTSYAPTSLCPPSDQRPPTEPRLTATTEWIFYGGVALFGLRAWAFGFGKAHRERLPAIMAYSIGSMLLTIEVRPPAPARR